MLYGFRFTWFDSTDTGHVNIFGGKEIARNVSVDGFFTDIELVGVVCCNMMDGLSSPK
jgi:hypothetical protein